MAQAEASGEPAFLMAVHHVAGVALEFMGDFTESSRLLERARELHQPEQHKQYSATFGIDPGMVARAMSSRPLWALGHPDRALERSLETIALCRSQRQPVTHVFALIVNQGIHLYRGELDETIARGDEIVALCREYEFPQELEWARAFQGSAMASKGALDAGICQLQACLQHLDALKSGLVRTTFLSLLADACCRGKRIDEGRRTVEEGFAYADKSLEHGFLGELHRTRGELFRLTGQFEEAEQALVVALEHARERHARGFELRAAIALASLLHDGGRTAEARQLLVPVVDWFTEGATTADLTVGRALRARLQ
jgi:tetratricopeptide (TPR) repeat protein